RTWRFESRPGVKQWHALDSRAFDLQKRGDFSGAVPLFEQALPLAEDTKQATIIATALNNLAAAYMDAERLAEASPLFQRAYEIRKEAIGADNELTLATAERATSCETALGQWGRAEAIQR